MVKSAANAGCGAEGAIRIGILSSLSNGFVRDLLARYRAEHPEIEIDLVEGPARAVSQQFDRRDSRIGCLCDSWCSPHEGGGGDGAFR